MKKFSIRAISLLLCMAMVLGYALVPGMMPVAKAATDNLSLVGENLIANGTFEPEKNWFNRPKDNTAEGWTKNCSKCWSFVKDPDNSSNYVAYVNDNNINCNGGYIYYVIDAPEPGSYAVSFRYKTVNENASPSIYVREESPSSTYVDPTTGEKVDTPTQITNIPATGGEWKTYSFHTTVSEAASKIYLLINSALIAQTEAYFDDVAFYSIDMEGLESRFLNLSFEQADADGVVTNWHELEDGIITLSDDAKLGKKSLQIMDISASAQQGAVSDWCSLYNYTALGYEENDLRFVLSGRIKDTAEVSEQIALEFYDSGLNKISEFTVTSAKSGQWQYLTAEGKMPLNTTYARIALRVGESASDTGTVYFDDVTVMHYYGQYMEEPYDWQLLIKEPGSRVYYTDEELATIKALATDTTVGPFGVSGKSMYDALIKKANSYVSKEVLKVSYDRTDYGWTDIVDYPYSLVDMQDINTIEEFITIEPGKSSWPHLEGLASHLRTYVEYLSMAYALTGKVSYANKAIDIAMGVCAWEHWMELDYSWRTSLGTELGSPRVVMTVATVYDMCYDVLTEEQRQIMEQSIINKGLLPLYNILTGPKKQAAHNKAMITCAALMFGALTVIDEDNKDTVGKFLDRAYAYNTWYLDHQYETGSQEGYSYSRLCYEEPIIAMDCLTRVTGREGLLNHVYFNEVFVNWICDFLKPGSNNLPEYSDCYGSTAGELYKGAMLILNKQGNKELRGKAGYYLQKTGLGGDPFIGLLYYNPNPEISKPTENDYVVFVDCVGYGGLRTGWEDGDMMFYIIGNNSTVGHNQYDQLSFQIAVGDGKNAQMLAADPGYQRLDGFNEREGHSTIVVDGWGQTVKGNGTLSQIVDGKLYGQLSGSAPGAYAEGLLTQYDRQAIMINHNDRPYYIIIDELNSNAEHVYDWNLNTLGWTEVLVDGVPLGNTPLAGNKVAISGTNGKLFVEFVSKNKLNIEGKLYGDMEKYAGSGKAYAGGDYPVLQADAGSSKSQQFLTILSKDYDGSVSSPIYTQEVYDTDKVLGAKIYHNAYNSDIILHNRTTGSITAGGVTTNGKQTTIIGLREDGYMEGYAVVGGTSLKRNNTVLMSAQKPATVSADFQGKASYIVTTETAQTVSLYASSQIIGVTVDGKNVDYTVSNGMAVVALAAGTRVVELITAEAIAYIHAEDGTLAKIAYYKNGQYDYATDANGKRIDCGVHDYHITVTAPTCTTIGYTTYTCSICEQSYQTDEIPVTGHSWIDSVCSICNTACEHVYDNAWDDVCNDCGAGRKVSVVPNGTFDEIAQFPAYRITKEGQAPGWKTGGSPGQENIGVYVTKAWYTHGEWSLRIDDNLDTSAVSMSNFVTLPATDKTDNRTITLSFDYNVKGTILAQFLVAGKNAGSKTLPQGTGKYTMSITVASDVTEVQIKITTRSTETGIVAYFDNLVCTVDGSENLLTNPSFEEDIVGVVQSTVDAVGLKTDGWYMSQSEIIYEDSTRQNGVLKVEDMDTSKSASPNIKVQVLPNTTYTFTFDYMTGSGKTQPKMFIRENTASSSEITILEEKLALKTGWTTMTYTITTKATTNVICIFPNFTSGQTNGVIYLDNVTLTKASHVYQAVVTAPTCEEDGYTTYTCTICGHSYTEVIATTGHSYEKVVVAPTCTNMGYTEYICTICDDSYLEDLVDARGHTAADAIKSNEIPATCTTDGSYVLVVDCAVCGAAMSRKTVTVPATGHTYESIVVEPTCTSPGHTEYTCTVCDESYLEDLVDARGHTAADAVKTNEIPATCTTDGSYVLVVDCTVCGAAMSRKTVTVPATGHSYEAAVTAPTCIEAGYTTYTCSICADTYTETIPATGVHNYVDGTCTGCGASEGPLVDANLKFMGDAGISFQDYIGMNIMFQNSKAKNYDSFYVVATQVAPDGTITESVCNAVPYGKTYTIFEHPVMAWSMTEQVTLTLYAKSGDKIFVGESRTASVESLALTKLAGFVKAGTTENCAMLVDMLNYGAELQKNQKHFTDSIPSAGEYAIYATVATPDLTATTTKTGDGKGFLNGPNISMQAKVEFNVMFKGVEMVWRTVKVYADGEELEDAVEFQAYSSYQIARIAIKATQMRSTFTIALYDDATGEAYTQVITTSVEALGLQNITAGKNVDLVNALIRYGDSVYAYANKGK